MSVTPAAAKKRPEQRAYLDQLILGEGLPGASRRDFVAVSTDNPAGYGIKDTLTGKVFADDESSGDLPEFLITQLAGASPAKHAACFLRIRHAMLLS
jgi:hypothetical protein